MFVLVHRNHFVAIAALLIAVTLPGADAQKAPGAATIVQQMVSREHDAFLHEPRLSYISIERSDRTGGHEWTERVIEVPQGKLRRLLLVDGKPLTVERANREAARLRAIARDPQAFIERERSRSSDAEKAEQMFDLLPRAFLFRDAGWDQSWKRIDYWPNPAYAPRSYEERILHGMSGTMLIDMSTMRLRMLQGRLADNVSFGLGLLATIHGGSNFIITRSPVLPDQWKTTSLHVSMNGFILLFKTLDRREVFIHRDFKAIPANLTIQKGVALLLQ